MSGFCSGVEAKEEGGEDYDLDPNRTARCCKSHDSTDDCQRNGLCLDSGRSRGVAGEAVVGVREGSPSLLVLPGYDVRRARPVVGCLAGQGVSADVGELEMVIVTKSCKTFGAELHGANGAI